MRNGSADQLAAQSNQIENERSLRRAEARENLALASLALPGTLLLFCAIVLPLSVMTYFAFIGADGDYSLENFERIWSRRVYFLVFKITFEVSVYTTLLVALIGYPLAYFIVQLPSRLQNIALICVILPLWSAVLVRTYAWLVLLQDNGVINSALIAFGVVSEPLDISYNFSAVLIGMVHILLPFLVLPLYSSMKAIDQNLMAAASNLGAPPARAFLNVYVPLSMPGFLAGILMVFVLCIGFYITPAVLGGGRVIMVAMRIESNISDFSNWGAASALGVVLFVITMSLVALAASISKRAGGGVFK